MNRHLIFLMMFVVLTGCATTTPPPIPQFPFKEKQKDSDGYYKYATYWFKGTLKNGVPHGEGQCRTRLLKDEYHSVWLDSTCEFNAGERIDDLHKEHSENNLAVTNKIRADHLQKQKEEAQEQARAEAEERRERARSRAAFEQQMGASLTGLNQQMMRDHQQMTAMVQKASTPPVQVRTYTPSRLSSSYDSSSRTSDSSSPSSTSSSSKSSSSSSSSVSSSEGTSNINEMNAKAEADKKKSVNALKQQELEQQRDNEAKLAKEQKAREEEERQREIQLANEKRENELQAEKLRQEHELLAKKQSEEQAKRNYLANLRSAIRLQARSCYGSNYVVGIRPKTSPQLVSGINVHYRAYCPSGGSYSGISKNFIGIGTDCFTGDTVGNEIPKSVLSCNAEDITVEVTKVTSSR